MTAIVTTSWTVLAVNATNRNLAVVTPGAGGAIRLEALLSAVWTLVGVYAKAETVTIDVGATSIRAVGLGAAGDVTVVPKQVATAGLTTPVSGTAFLGELAAASLLDPLTTYVDTTTGQRYWALNATTFLSSGESFDVSELNFIESGLIPPSTGTIAAATLTAGVAYIEGNRVALAATPLTLTATSDNYIDVTRAGVIVVTAVGVAAASPAIPANSMRLGYSQTDAANVTLNSTNAFDSLGNWMGNVTPKPSCRLRSNTLQGSGGAEISVAFPEADVFDNASMHDPVTNNSRINFSSPGTYFMSCAIAFSAPQTPLSSFALYVRMNGATEETTFPQDSRGTAAALISMQTSGFVTVPPAPVGTPQYAEFRFIPNGVVGATLSAAWLQCTKIS